MPSRAFLTFSDAIIEVHEVTVVGPEGSVTNGDPTSVGAEVRQTLGAGPDGAYTMDYYVVSADGHDDHAGRSTSRWAPCPSLLTAGLPDPMPPPRRVRTASGRAAATLRCPSALVLLAGAAALVLLRRQRSRLTARGRGRAVCRLLRVTPHAPGAATITS